MPFTEPAVPLLLANEPVSFSPVVRLFNFQLCIGERDILASGVPKLNKVDTCEADNSELNIAKLLILPSKP